MSTFMDIFMSILFVLFMVFVFGGYHKNKSAKREAQREADEQKAKEEEDIILK